MNFFFIVGWLVLNTRPGTAYYTGLKALRTTRGTWEKPFDVKVTDYNIALDPTTQTVSIEVEVDFTQYDNPSLWPVVAFNGQEVQYDKVTPIMQDYPLTSTPGKLKLNIDISVKQPVGSIPQKTVYHLHLFRPPDLSKVVLPTALSVSDDAGNTLSLMPAFDPANPAPEYDTYVNTNVKMLNIKATCNPLAHVEVNSSPDTGQPFQIPLNPHLFRTVVRVACVYQTERKTFFVNVRPQVDPSKVSVQLHVAGEPIEGIVKQGSGGGFRIYGKRSSIRLVPFCSEAHVILDLEIPGPPPKHYRLQSGFPTDPFQVPDDGTKKSMTLTVRLGGAAGGTTNAKYQILLMKYVPPPPSPDLLHSRRAAALGYSLVAFVCSNAMLVTLILAVSLLVGLGSPVGPSFAVGSLGSLAFVLQFVALSDTSQGPNSLTDMTSVLQWLALIPAPRGFQPMGPAANLSQQQATSCVVCAAALLCTLIIMHLLILLCRLCRGCSHTSPHRLGFGGWESHCILIIAYPASMASSLLLLRGSDGMSGLMGVVLPSTLVKGFSIVLLALPWLLAAAAARRVRQAVERHEITWIFEGLDPESERDELGHFCDVTCDQLSTIPTARSFCPGIFHGQWNATLADVRPVDVEQAIEQESEHLLSLKERGCKPRALGASTPRAEVSKLLEVVVVSTLPPSGFFHPFFSEAGRVDNVPWLEAFLSAEALLRLHQEVDNRDYAGPTTLSVEVGQLQGPVCCGWLAFCFDGVRWPYLLPVELVVRTGSGVLSAVLVAYPQSGIVTLGYLCQCIIQVLAFALAFYHMPFTIFLDNVLLLLVHFGLALVSLGFCAYSAGHFGLDTCATVVLASSLAVIIPLTIHVMLSNLTLFSAVTCPPLTAREAKVRAIPNVDLSLRGARDAWLMVIPAVCKLPVRDAFVHAIPSEDGSVEVYVEENIVRSSRPRLEFPVLDFIAQDDKLEPPLVILFGPTDRTTGPLAYRSEAIYPDEDPRALVTEFLSRDSSTHSYAPEIVYEVMQLIKLQAGPGRILVVDVVPISSGKKPSIWGEDSSSEEEELRRIWDSRTFEMTKL